MMKFLYTFIAFLGLFLNTQNAAAELVNVTGGLDIYDMATHGTNLYFSEIGADKISKVDLTKPIPIDSEDFLAGITDPFHLTVFEDYLYFVSGTSPEILRIDLLDAGATVETFVTGLSVGVGGIVIKDGELYFSQLASIYKVSPSGISGTPTPVFLSEVHLGLGPLAFHGEVLYASVGIESIMRIDLSVSEPVLDTFLTTTDLRFPQGLLIEEDYLYVCNRDYFSVNRIDLSASPITLPSIVDLFSMTIPPKDIIRYEGELYISGGFKIVKLTETITEIQEYSFTESSVYPNPTSDRIYLDLIEQPDAWKVFDLQGRTIESNARLNGSTMEVDLSYEATGTYQLVLFKEDQIQTHRFIKL